MGMAAYKDFAPEELDLQINRQIYFIVEGIVDKHFGRTIKVDEKQGFQSNQVTLDNLRFLQAGAAPAVQVFNGKKYVIIPDDYYHHIKTTVTITYPCYEDGKEIIHTEDVDLRIGQLQYDMKRHPFHKTGRDSVLGEITNGAMFIEEGNFTVTKALISYIKKPAKVKFGYDPVTGDYDPATSVQCDLDDSLLYMLVNMTSTKIMELIETNQQKIVNSQRETT
jgi:hypothetical protein